MSERGTSPASAVRAVGAVVLAAALLSVPLAIWLAGDREPLPALYPMPAFELTSEQGTPWGSERLAGKVAVVNFVFTTCPTVCPMLTTHMARVQGRFASEERVHLVSISVDPKNDTPEVLRTYGAQFGQNPDRWTFLTGPWDEIARAVEQGFKVGLRGGDRPDATPFDIVHGEHFVLVDAKGVIRGYYQPSAESLEQLTADVRRLLAEPGDPS